MHNNCIIEGMKGWVPLVNRPVYGHRKYTAVEATAVHNIWFTLIRGPVTAIISARRRLSSSRENSVVLWSVVKCNDISVIRVYSIMYVYVLTSSSLLVPVHRQLTRFLRNYWGCRVSPVWLCLLSQVPCIFVLRQFRH